MRDYVRAESVEEAIEALKAPGAVPFSGGTDILVKRRLGIVDPAVLVDVSSIPEMNGLNEKGGDIEIGAALPITEILDSELVSEVLPLLPEVFSKIGSLQIRNRATLGGNLANASPAADSAIPLLLYEARLDLVGPTGRRELPIEGFFRGPGKTALGKGELIRAVLIPIPEPGFKGFFHKVGKRKALTIAIASLGVLARASDRRIEEIRIAAGSVAPTPIRLHRTERLLTGAKPAGEAIERARKSARDEVSPIDDIRGSAAYRKTVIGDLTARAIEAVGP